MERYFLKNKKKVIYLIVGNVKKVKTGGREIRGKRKEGRRGNPNLLSKHRIGLVTWGFSPNRIL